MKTIKTTAKAALIENENGVQFWVQNRWLRADGSLTPSGLKAEKEATEKVSLGAKGTDNECQVEIIKETEKALLLEFPSAGYKQTLMVGVKNWFPKSLVKFTDENKTRAVLPNFKIRELKQAIADSANGIISRAYIN